MATLALPPRPGRPWLVGLLCALLLAGLLSPLVLLHYTTWPILFVAAPVFPFVGIFWGRYAEQRAFLKRLEEALDAALKRLQRADDVETAYFALKDALEGHPGVAGAALFVRGSRVGRSGISPVITSGALLGLRGLPRVGDFEHLAFMTRTEEVISRRDLKYRAERGQNATAIKPLLSVLEDASLDLLWILTSEEGPVAAVVMREAVGADLSRDAVRDCFAERSQSFGRALWSVLPQTLEGSGTEEFPKIEPAPKSKDGATEGPRLTPPPPEPPIDIAKGITSSQELKSVQRPTTPPQEAPKATPPEPVYLAARATPVPPAPPEPSPRSALAPQAETRPTPAPPAPVETLPAPRATVTQPPSPAPSNEREPEIEHRAPFSLYADAVRFVESFTPLAATLAAARETLRRERVVRLLGPRGSSKNQLALALALEQNNVIDWQASPIESDPIGPDAAVIVWDEERAGPCPKERGALLWIVLATGGEGLGVPLLKELGAAEVAKLAASQLSTKAISFTEEAERALQDFCWRGDIEEVALLVARALLLEGEDAPLRMEFILPAKPAESSLLGEVILAPDPANEEQGEPMSAQELLESAEEVPLQPLQQAVALFKKAMVRKALEECKGNRAQAARRLGLQRTYLYRLIRQLEIEEEAQKAFDEPSPPR